MPLHKAATVLALLAAGAVFAGCSMFKLETKKIDYKSAQKLPPLEVPPDLIRPSADDRYTVPDINPRGTATYSEYARERSGAMRTGDDRVLPRIEGARVMRDGNQRWLVVKGSPEEVWPVVKSFWQESGFIVNLESPEAGIMETDWAENRARINDGLVRGFLGRMLDTLYSTGERDKYRTRLERGIEPGTTEIYISHRGMEEVYTSASRDESDTRWQPRPPDPGLEAEMLGRLLVRFGVEESKAKSMVAQGRKAPDRATLLKGPDGIRALTLDEQFDRAWRRVGLALDRVGFTVEDRDRSKGLYFVRYMDPGIDNARKDEGGWLSRLKFWGGSKPKQLEQYRIAVKNAQDGCEVQVLSKDGTLETSDTAGRILSLLYEQLR